MEDYRGRVISDLKLLGWQTKKWKWNADVVLRSEASAVLQKQVSARRVGAALLLFFGWCSSKLVQ